MSKFQTFTFESYKFDPALKTAEFTYRYDDDLRFTESFTFNFDFVSYDQATLNRALEMLFFIAGVSYYKMYLAPSVSIEMGQIDTELAGFLNETYREGLGEFCYVNQLPLIEHDIFQPNTNSLPDVPAQGLSGKLVALGGGKDSLVSVELLRATPEVATWSVGHKPQLTPLVERIGLPHYWVERSWDRNMLEHNDQGAYNGHVPISAILACAGVVTAILSGKEDVVVSNEHSANEPTLNYNGKPINHQYSKSQQFEASFQVVLQRSFGDSVRYYSLLRPFSELKIAEMFAPHFNKYHDVFSSCNRAFTHTQTTIFWDGSCPKCAFVFLALTPFVARQDLEALFGGKNLLLDDTLQPMYLKLLGIEGDKPLECVGEVKECRAAMQLAQRIYPELAHYQFELPADYDFRTQHSHCLSSDVIGLLPLA